MIRAFIFLTVLSIASCWPGACVQPPMATTDPDPNDTGIAVRDSYPDIKPPRPPR